MREKSVIMESIYTGLFGGVIFGLLNSFTYALKFNEVSHASFIFRSFFEGNWTSTWWIELISAIILGVLAILPAVIYYALLRRFRGISPGLLYGILLWGVIFWLANGLFDYVPTIENLTKETIATTLCQFALYGVFVGYTISYNQHGERVARKV
ncbi:YqhR family membrane protein [Alkalibacillus almallahensis]|uniref:YqhR family membrane protein n=1 Tax=Alkalibacillus almallahensis TaxID=1379154 RepID=UPI00141F8FE5|nr:YqhR family membrane protein [Alkalibacillus almallahensis]NIK12425.1 hypothetical protein [Alkalibacillus almallahensis]